YRYYYKSCSGKYQVSVPFTELFFDLAYRSGHVGMITSNAFMKRSFGKKLIEEYVPRWDLTHVIDTSGAYLPGHGTPTAILFGRNRRPVAEKIRAVLGIRGEPTTPEVPEHGFVWRSILSLSGNGEARNEFVSAGYSPREAFGR